MHSYEGLDPQGGFDRTRLLAPLKDRNFRFLWLGLSISMLGDGVFMVALAWQAFELSDAPTALSMVGLAMSLPHILLLLVGGVVSDRVSRRKVMLASDVVRGVSIASVAALSLSGDLNLGVLAICAAVYGAGMAFFGPSFDAIVPDIVPPEDLPGANSLDQLMKPLMLRLGGPALGGILIGVFGVGIAFAFDALTFLVSACSLMAMTTSVVHQRAEDPVRRQLADGFAFIKANVWLWGTFLAASIAYLLFLGPAEVLLPYIVKEELGGSATDLGLIFAVGGAGSIASAFVMSGVRSPRRCITFIYVVWTFSTLAIAGYGLATHSWHLMAAGFAFNALESAGTIVWMTTKQRLVPPSLLGRVSSLDWLISIGLMPVSFALTGPVSAAIGARSTLVGAGLLGAAVTAGALFLKGSRDIERTPVPTEALAA